MSWIKIEGYGGKYKINDLGYVKNDESGLLIQPNTTTSDLRRVGLYKDSKTNHHFIHKLVYQHFIGEIPPNHYVYHLDGNVKNNRVDNLRLREGKKPRQSHPTRRYPLEIKQQILKDIEDGVRSKDIIKQYSLSPSYLSKIKKGYWSKYKNT